MIAPEDAAPLAASANASNGLTNGGFGGNDPALDHTATAGLVSPPASIIPLSDAMARVSYIAQLGE